MDHVDRPLEGTPCEVYFFESWSSYSHPVRPIRPNSYEEALRRDQYYRAWLSVGGAQPLFLMLEGILLRRTPFRGSVPPDTLEGSSFYRVIGSGSDVRLGGSLSLTETFDADEYIAVTRADAATIASVVRASLRLRYRYRYDAKGTVTVAEITGPDGVVKKLLYQD